jgi:hypothetical protein
MSTITIKNMCGDDPVRALNRILIVMGHGLISSTKHGPSYCAMTTFKDGTTVDCRKTAKGYVFYIYMADKIGEAL